MDTRLRRLFLDTVRDLGETYEQGASDYAFMRGSVLIRSLFLDGGRSLVDRVRREVRVDLAFDVIDPGGELPIDVQPVVRLELAPGWQSPNSRHRITMTRERFFCAPMGHIRDEPIKVQDLVRYAAHVAGGAHFGLAKKGYEIELQAFDEFTQAYEGRDVSMGFLRNVGLITHRALQPLVEKI